MGQHFCLQRRRDSNPRRCYPQRFSRPPQSTTLPLLWLALGIKKGFSSAEKAFLQRGGDSNPRYRCRYNGFRIRRIRPLCHLSVAQMSGLGTAKLVGHVARCKYTGQKNLLPGPLAPHLAGFQSDIFQAEALAAWLALRALPLPVTASTLTFTSKPRIRVMHTKSSHTINPTSVPIEP